MKFNTAAEFLSAITEKPHYDDVDRTRYTADNNGKVSVRTPEGGRKEQSLCEVYRSIKNRNLTDVEPIKAGDIVIETKPNGDKIIKLVSNAREITPNMTAIPSFARQHPFWSEIFKEMRTKEMANL